MLAGRWLGGVVPYTVDRPSKIVSRVTVGSILRFRGVPGGWVWVRAILGTVEGTYV